MVKRRQPLSEQQLNFIRYYLGSKQVNMRAAALKAGYALSKANSAAALLKSKAVVDEIRRRTLPMARKLDIRAERVLQELAGIAYANILDFGCVTEDGGFVIDLSAMDRVAAGGIASIKTRTYTMGKGEDARTVVETELKLADRRPALEALGRHLKILGADQVQEMQPIRLILEHAPALPTPDAQMINIRDLVKDEARDEWS